MNSNFFKAIRSFLTVYLPTQKCCSEHTIKAYREVLNSFVSFLQYQKNLKLKDISFSTIDNTTVTDFLDHLQYSKQISAATRNHRLAVLRSFFKYAGAFDCSVFETRIALESIPQQKGVSKTVEYLSENALKCLLQQPSTQRQTDYRNLVLMSLMYDSAARCSEILNLKIKDLRLDEQNPTIYLFGKGEKMRIVPLMNVTAMHCRKYIEQFHPLQSRNPEDYLFYTTIHGQRNMMSPDNVAYFMNKYGKMAKRICDEIPDKVHPHQLRHTRAIHLYRNGMPLYLLSEFLGHSNSETTKIYAYADTEMKRKAIQRIEEKCKTTTDFEEPIWKDDGAMLRKLCGLM